MLVLLGTIIGGFLSFIWSVVLARISETQAALTELLDELQKLQDLVMQFWCRPRILGADVYELDQLKIAVGVSMQLTAQYEKVLIRSLRVKFDEYQGLDDKLFDLVTGGEFDSRVRVADSNRAFQACEVCAEMRKIVRDSRFKLLGPH
jgi:hypothetical protein